VTGTTAFDALEVISNTAVNCPKSSEELLVILTCAVPTDGDCTEMIRPALAEEANNMNSPRAKKLDSIALEFPFCRTN
jgi:hypothetical protein